jgi:hypothetical protein
MHAAAGVRIPQCASAELASAHFSSLPPCCLLQVSEDMPLALVQQQADAAFALLRQAKKLDSTLF